MIINTNDIINFFLKRGVEKKEANSWILKTIEQIQSSSATEKNQDQVSFWLTFMRLSIKNGW